jgi:hypothetical protein
LAANAADRSAKRRQRISAFAGVVFYDSQPVVEVDRSAILGENGNNGHS